MMVKGRRNRAMGGHKRKPPKVTFYPRPQPGKKSGGVCPVRVSGVGEEEALPIHI